MHPSLETCKQVSDESRLRSVSYPFSLSWLHGIRKFENSLCAPAVHLSDITYCLITKSYLISLSLGTNVVVPSLD